MHATKTYATFIAITATTLALDPNNFRLYQHHYTQQQCGPAACGGNNIDQWYIAVHDDCNGGGACNADTTDHQDSYDSLCDVDFEVCDRTLRIEYAAGQDCKKVIDLRDSDDGQGYGLLMENGNEVGACRVDLSRYRHCPISFGSVGANSKVFCYFH
ncbi:hypothetical protein AA0119_g6684 [Alternaria tenuissima]|uniref:Uncharacterized protein n=1 Tax=Alternaria tenuissima TaxID=119927 RepID=A0ABY0GBB2_9PLEO|nr:hypothetical protein B0T12DRAFT_516232 [Alternaria alternata]RYN98833.1 hypothetical protein AA0119_g6684 [Alternaria tenuissima]RYO23416.1 hypothetical protein AA0121_g2174 [Alternaria tenuissima]